MESDNLKKWYAMTLQERKEAAFEAFLKLYPNDSISVFYEMEIAHWNREVKLYEERNDNPAPYETRFVVEAKRMLHFYRELALPRQQTKTNKLNAPVLGLFCSLINKIGIDKKKERESATVYCERICGKFKIPYTDRVRQNYNVNETKKLIQELTEKVLPLIDTETKNSIQKYLDNKQSTKQNLYA
jgi:hypothetical protein